MAKEQRLHYQYERWQGENADFCVWLSDATLRKHLKAYLEAQGVCPLTYVELMEQVKQIREQQEEAWQRLLCLDYWLSCDDPDVTVQPLTMAAYMQRKGEK
jgi:hypothetical protein